MIDTFGIRGCTRMPVMLLTNAEPLSAVYLSNECSTCDSVNRSVATRAILFSSNQLIRGFVSAIRCSLFPAIKSRVSVNN